MDYQSENLLYLHGQFYVKAKETILYFLSTLFPLTLNDGSSTHNFSTTPITSVPSIHTQGSWSTLFPLLKKFHGFRKERQFISGVSSYQVKYHWETLLSTGSEVAYLQHFWMLSNLLTHPSNFQNLHVLTFLLPRYRIN